MENKQFKYWQDVTAKAFTEANIIITEDEKNKIEIADFGLENFEKFGLGILTYVNTERVCAKELVLLPNQVCPEHCHPSINGKEGKEETFRCRKGKVFLYVPGERNVSPENILAPNGSVFTVFHEIVLNEGEQYTIYPNTLHWFVGGNDGAVVSEFSTKSTDEQDVFSDKKITR